MGLRISLRQWRKSASAIGRATARLPLSRGRPGPSPTVPDDVTMTEDIVNRVNTLSRAVDGTAHRVEVLRFGVLGLLSAIARQDPEIASKIMRDLIFVLETMADEDTDEAYKAELLALREDIRRELLAVVDRDGQDRSSNPPSSA